MTGTSTRPARTPRAFAIAFAIGLAAALAVGAPASAHTQVSPASPEPGSTVTTGPVTIALNTTEPVLESGQKSIVVRGPGDEERYFGDGCASISNGLTLSTDVTLGKPGEYTVIWTLVAEDGHTQSSDDFEPFTFTWQPDEGQDTVEGSATVPTCGEEPPDDDSSNSSSDSNSSSGEPSESASAGDDESGDGASGDATENVQDSSDIGWLIAAGAIVFIAAAAVVMILVRRRMLAGDAEDEDAAAGDDSDGTGTSTDDGPPTP